AARGTVVQGGTVAGNILTNARAHYGEGLDAAALASVNGVVSQAFTVNNNVIAGNAVGVYLRAGDRIFPGQQTLTGGTVSQVFSFTGNQITSNNANFVSGGISAAGHGLYAIASGTGATQVIDLVSGNSITGNSGDGVRLIDTGNAHQTATLRSNLGGGPVLNTITANGANLFYNHGAGQVVFK